MKRSTIGLRAMYSLSFKMARYPWIASKLVGIQASKWFFNSLHPRSSNGLGHPIRQLSLRVTDLCNLRCTTCGQWGSGGFMHGKDLEECIKEEVSPERYIEIINDLVCHDHHPMVYLWGGEPMLYRNVLDIINAATELKLPVSIATNGTRIADVAERLVRAPLFLLQVSIDGHCAELHNRIRPALSGRGNTFGTIEAGLAALHEQRRLQQRDLPFIASLTTISRENAHHLTDIYEAFCDRVDFFIFYLAWWIDEKSAQAHDWDFSQRFGFTPQLHRGWIGTWKPDDYHSLDRQLQRLMELSRSRNAPPVILIPPLTGAENLRRYYTNHAELFGFNQCISIFHAAEVNSNGDVSPCRDYHDYVVGNIKQSTLSDLWNSPAYRTFRQNVAIKGLMPVCTRCCGLMGY
jgi:radical SAM protein with 4Fe4S-binding SPASM domain